MNRWRIGELAAESDVIPDSKLIDAVCEIDVVAHEQRVSR